MPNFTFEPDPQPQAAPQPTFSFTPDTETTPQMGFTFEPDVDPFSEAEHELAYETYKRNLATMAGPDTVLPDLTMFKSMGQTPTWLPLAKQPRNYYQKVAEQFKRGTENFLLDQENTQAMFLGDQAKQDELYKQWKRLKAVDQYDPIEGDNLLEKMHYGLSRILPGMLEGTSQAWDEIAMAGLSAAAAGQAGLQVAIPEEVITIPAAMTVGLKIGSTRAWYMQGVGEMLFNMRELGVEGQTADVVASIAGIPYALIEQLQVGQVTPGLREGVNKVVQTSVLKVLGKAVAKYGTTLGQETLEEMTQEIVAISAEEIVKLLEQEGYDLDSIDIDGAIERVTGTGKEALISMALLPIPGAVIDYTTGHRNLITAKKLTEKGYGQEQAEQLLLNMKHGMPLPQAHEHMVNQMIAQSHNTTGGSTINPNTGKSVGEGFAVAIAGETEQILDTEEITPDDVAAYKLQHEELLKEHPSLTVGTWRHQGKSYLDLSLVLPTRDSAMQMADAQQQLAIYDLSAGEEIMVPTYESLLDRAYAGDEAAVRAIQDGDYRTETLQSEMPFEKEPVGFEISEPSPNYTAAADKAPGGTVGDKTLPRQSHKNPWVRQTGAKENKGRTLVVQFSTNLLTEGKEDKQATDYSDKLYGTRKGYNRGKDFWEIPHWIARVTSMNPNTDLYVVRDMDEAIAFLNTAGYDDVLFSALDVNKDFIRTIAANYQGELTVGGYVGGETFADLPNVKWYDDLSPPGEPEAPIKIGKQEGWEVSEGKAGGTIKKIRGVDDDGNPQELTLVFNKDGDLVETRLQVPGKGVLDPEANVLRPEVGLFNDGKKLRVEDDPSLVFERIDGLFTPAPRAIAETRAGAQKVSAAEDKGWKVGEGTDYRLFKKMKVIPRLCLSKGCKHGCKFCIVPKDLTMTDQEVIDRQVDAMLDLDAELVYLDDKTFGQAENYEYLIQLNNRMKQRNPNFRGFIIQTTAAQMTKFSDEFLKASGIKYIELGVESYNDSILREMKKPASEALIDKAVEQMRRNNISFIPNIMIGLPGETAETYQRTLDFLTKNQDIISHMNIYNLALYADSQLAQELSAQIEPQAGGEGPREVYQKLNAVKTGEPITVSLYRGIGEKRPTGYVSDPGDLGRGAYWTNIEALAKSYAGEKGNVRKEVKTFNNPLVLTADEAIKLVDKYDTIRPSQKQRLENAQQLTTDLLSQGYDALIVKGYDAGPGGFTVVELSPAPPKPAEAGISDDINEYVVAKSFHENPQVHIDFADKVYKLASDTLDTPSISEVDPASAWQKIKIHSLSKALGMKEKQRRELQVKLTEKKSAKDMTTVEADLVIAELMKLAKTAGVVTSTGAELAEHIREKSGIEQPKGTKGVDPKGLRKLLKALQSGTDQFFAGLTRIERMMEALDGYEKGPMYHSIWMPVNRNLMQVQEEKTRRGMAFIEFVLDTVGGVEQAEKVLFGKSETIAEESEGHPEINLTPTERIGVYIYSRNADSLHHLRNGNFRDHENPDIAIIEVIESMTEQEKLIGDWLIADMKAQFARVNQAAQLGLGREIQQQDNYFAMYFNDEDLIDQTDFLSSLIQNIQAGTKYEIGEVKARKKGARQPLRLDAFDNYFYHIDRVEQFVHMAPLARSIGTILKDSDFRSALNDATRGTGPAILDKWLHDSIRGFAAEVHSTVGRMLLTWRKNATVYALAFKIPSVMRQVISITNAMGVHPDVAAHLAKHLALGQRERNYKQLEQRALSMSLTMRTRIMDPLEELIGRGTTSEQKVLGQIPWSKKAMSWIRYSDRHTVTYAWNALFDAAKESEGVKRMFNLDGSDKMAVEFADSWLGKTQPMGGVQHLPDFYRGGVVERLLTTFQNQVNNNLNFWKNDILGEYRAGHLSNEMVAYRVLTSYVIPAFVFGMIGRGGLPKRWEDALYDQLVYMLGPFFMAGRVVLNGLQGFRGFGNIAEIWADELSGAIKAAIKGEYGKAAVKAAKSGGAVTGYVPQQVFTTGEGAYDLYTGDTRDLRRLIWSEWSLKGSEQETEGIER